VLDVQFNVQLARAGVQLLMVRAGGARTLPCSPASAGSLAKWGSSSAGQSSVGLRRAVSLQGCHTRPPREALRATSRFPGCWLPVASPLLPLGCPSLVSPMGLSKTPGSAWVAPRSKCAGGECSERCSRKARGLPLTKRAGFFPTRAPSSSSR